MKQSLLIQNWWWIKTHLLRMSFKPPLIIKSNCNSIISKGHSGTGQSSSSHIPQLHFHVALVIKYSHMWLLRMLFCPFLRNIYILIYADWTQTTGRHMPSCFQIQCVPKPITNPITVYPSTRPLFMPWHYQTLQMN